MRYPLALLVCLSAVAAVAQTPPPPVAEPSFGQESDGRRMLVRARQRLQSERGASFVCRWSSVATGAKPSTGTETLAIGDGRARFDLLQESGAGDTRSVRRAVLANTQLVALRYDAKPVRREVASLPEESVAGQWTRALSAIGVEPKSRGAALALGSAPISGLLWRAADGSVLEAPFGPRRPGEPERVRRYRIAADGFLQGFEEWTTSKGRSGKAQTTYRREDYSTAPRRADLYAQNFPAGYTAARPVALAPLRRPEQQVDPKARQLLDAWRSAHERPLTIQATVFVDVFPEKRTEFSRDFGRRVDASRWLVWLRRPGRGRAQGERRGAEVVAITDGEKASGRRTTKVGDPENVWNALLSVGADDGNAQLGWFFDGPPRLDEFPTVAYVGRAVLDDGTEVDVIEATRSDKQRDSGGRNAEMIQTVRIALAADGFPRQFELRRRVNEDLTNEADQPPDFVRRVAWRDLLTDTEPAPDRFVVR